MASTTVASAANARRKAMLRLRMDDPTPYLTPKQKRVCGKYAITPGYNELIDIIDSESISKRVRVKNTSGGTWAAGKLLFQDTLKLTPQTSAVAANSPLAGSAVVLNVTGTWEVGMIVEITDGVNPSYAVVTAVNGGLGTITVDFLPYSYTTPTVTALPAYEATAADMNGAKPAEWVIKTAITNGNYGDAFDSVEVTGIDTSALTVESLQYLGAAGAYQAAVPSGADQCVQAVGIVKQSAVSGSIYFFPGNKRILKIGTSFLQPGANATPGVVIVTGAVALTAAQSGSTITNQGAGAGPASIPTLPAAAAGLWFRFFDQAGTLIKIIASGANTIRIGNAVSAAGGNIQNEYQGQFILLQAINATEWVAMPEALNWDVN